MKRILSFSQYINEADISMSNPDDAGARLATILAKSYGVREDPPGSNRGREVDEYLRAVGIDPTKGKYSWCQAYVYWALDQLAKRLGVTNPAPKTGGVKDHWDRTPAENKLTIAEARAHPEKVKPGMVFVAERGSIPWGQEGGDQGHCGIILNMDPKGKIFASAEGNTNERGTGIGNIVTANTHSLSEDKLVGFIDWFKGTRTPEFEKALSLGYIKERGLSIAATAIMPLSSERITTTIGGPPVKGMPDDLSGDGSGAATAKDNEPDESMLGDFLKPIRKTTAEAGITKGDTKKFTTGTTYYDDWAKKQKEKTGT